MPNIVGSPLHDRTGTAMRLTASRSEREMQSDTEHQ
jgi:hypothetical protein